MINLVGRSPPPLAKTAMIQEQLALAINRQASKVNEPERSILRERAEKVILDLLTKRGTNPETNGILGRIYKDSWEEALEEAGNVYSAVSGLLKKAIEAYLQGFEADWRDAYPGINAIKLMEISDPPDQRRYELFPVIQYAVERKIATGKPDYWDYATRLELGVLGRDENLTSLHFLMDWRQFGNHFNLRRLLKTLRLFLKRGNEDTNYRRFLLGQGKLKNVWIL
jgi:hypothetical protein